MKIFSMHLWFLAEQETKVFNRGRWEGNNPNDILVDFKRAAVNAIHHLNQHIEIKGCSYHLSFNIWKRDTVKTKNLP